MRSANLISSNGRTGGQAVGRTDKQEGLKGPNIGTNLLTKFHEDRKINVASRVLTRKNAPPPGSHVFQANINIIETNLLTKFHEDWTINVASRVLTRKNVPPTYIIGTNPLTKFHDDRKINVTSRVLTRKNAPPPGGHVFQPTGIIFDLFHEDRTVNVASRVKIAPPLGSHVFQSNISIFKLIQNIIETNLLTKFHVDWTINVASRVLTRKKCPAHWWPYIIGTNLLTKVLTRKNAPPPGGHVFQPTGIIFKLFQDIIGMNLLTEFHEDRTVNVASRVKNAPPLGSHVFQSNVTIFELIQTIKKTNLLTKFHEDWSINVTSRVLTSIIFELVQYIIGMNLLTKFHEDWTVNVASRVKNAPPLGSHVFQAKVTIYRKINVASRVLTRKNAPPLRPYIIGMNLLTKKNAQPLGSHVFQANVTIFELIQDSIETNLLTKIHEDWTINVLSRDLTRQMLTPHNSQRTTHNGRRTKGDHKSSP
ncbi:hypothetical protein DPMN_153159 [Dreissena polymorpha]|uniref:Uncharacterized protein n=1 Tax=Dreissena polymorpha TaxID=45954 RepID=A0A9D4J811_DREPO|nr:hypothetical protein DPMN_153159 [Dreissena polymorpha]